MSSRINTTIEVAQSTVILISQESVFTSQLQAAIETVHLQVVLIDPRNIPKLLVQDKTRNLFQTSYVCVWVDIPIFVSQREKEEMNDQLLATLKKHLHIPLHLITFDAVYGRKNGREGSIPTNASKQLLSSVLNLFPSAACFSYLHTLYPYEGGVSVVQRFLLEKIQQNNTAPLSGSWTPVWYSDVISHFISTLYDLSIKGGVFSGSQQVDLEHFESLLRKASHNRALSGKKVDFPFQFELGTPVGKTSMSTMVEELALIVLPPKTDLSQQNSQQPVVFTQKKLSPRKIKNRRKLWKVGKSISLGVGVLFGMYLAVSVLFFTLLGNVRSTVTHNVRLTDSQVWQSQTIDDLSTKLLILEKISTFIPLPYSVVGIQLPREGVEEGLRTVTRYISGIQSYHDATTLLGTRVVQITQKAPSTPVQSSQQILSLLDQGYKDLSAIQADVVRGNPIFDSLFGVDGLSTQIVQSTISVRESITQEKAIVSLVDSLADKPGQSVLLLVSVDPTLSRPFFGVPTDVVVITLENGRMKSSQVYQVSDLDQMLKGKVAMPQEMQKYFTSRDWKLSDGAWSADGPAAARELGWFVSKQLHVDIDTILFIDSSALTALAGEDTKNQESINVLGAHAVSPSLGEVVENLGQGNTYTFETFLPQVVKALNSSQAVLFSRDLSVAKTAKALAWDGSVRTPTCPPVFTVERDCTVLTRYLTEYDLNSSSDSAKLSTLKENQIHSVHVSKDSLAHLDTVTYPRTQSKNEQKVLKYLVDQDATITSILVNGSAVSLDTVSIGREYEKTSLIFPVLLSSDGPTTIVVSYTTPTVLAQKSSIVFFAQKQPGKSADPLTVEFTFTKDYVPSVVAPKALIEHSRMSFTTSLDTSKIFAIGF